MEGEATCASFEAYVTKIDQLHKLSYTPYEFILLVWTSVAVLSKSKTQMVPSGCQVRQENLVAIKVQLKTPLISRPSAECYINMQTFGFPWE